MTVKMQETKFGDILYTEITEKDEYMDRTYLKVNWNNNRNEALVPTKETLLEQTSSKLDKENPTGTGSFSLNREAGTTIGDYSFAEGMNTKASGEASHAEGTYTTASGDYSHAEGRVTIASGIISHAEGGDGTRALGQYSHAEGGATTASGNFSHAEGGGTTASGDYSHAEGRITIASGIISHAEGGDGTRASGQYSHAEGGATIASGDYSHAEGHSTKASSSAQHVQGEYNIEDSLDTYADIIGNGTSDSARSNAATVDWDGNAWYAGDVYVGSTSGTNKDAGSKKLATEEYVDSKQIQSDYEQNDSAAADYIKNRPFYVDGSTVDVETLYNKTELTFDIDVEIGISSCEIPGVRLSLVEGQTYIINFDDVDYIVQSHILEAEEGTTIGLGNLHIMDEALSDTGEPFILLYDEYSENEYSLVIATNIVDSTTHTLAIQTLVEHIVKLDNKFLDLSDYAKNEDLSDYAKNEDLSDYAKKTDLSGKMNSSNPTGSGSFSLNRRPGMPIGAFSFSEGSDTAASGNCSHAEGNITNALGNYSHAEGDATFASGNYSHAEGGGTAAGGDYSHAEGGATAASGISSHAEGSGTKASGQYSHAEGGTTTASGIYSHAEGLSTKASSRAQHVQGEYNIEDSSNIYADIIGNGNADNGNAGKGRSNAATVDWSGNAWYAGAVTSTGADYAEFFEWLDGNPNEEDRVGYLVALDGEKIKLAHPQDEILGIISASPAILGDNYECNWKGKYLVDEFGRILYEKVEEFIDVPKLDEETGETTIEKKSLGFFDHPKINPDYNPEQGYTNRRDRSEWATVGMLGKLIVRDDGTAEVNGYVTVKENGIATASTEKTNIRVLSRVNDHIIKVLLK